MKKSYITALLFFIFSLVKSYSQDCVVLGCAGAYPNQAADGTLGDVIGIPGTCYSSFPYKQIFWQFFYSPTGGVYTQTFKPTTPGFPTDLDYIAFDMNATTTTNLTCPIDITGWTPVLCNASQQSNNDPTGPGLDGILTTQAGHFYAIAIINWEGVSNGADPVNTFDVGNPQIDGIDLTPANCPITLPVKLTSFNAKVNNCTTDLEWMAEQPINLKSYEVQYSTDGVHFASVAAIQSPGAKKYTYQHSPQQGKSYYRLKMTDINGQFTFSKTIALTLDCNKNSVFVYPNPVTDRLNVNITNAQGNTSLVRLFDAGGKLVHHEIMNNGTNTINISALAKGIYLLTIKNNQEVQNIKIVKK